MSSTLSGSKAKSRVKKKYIKKKSKFYHQILLFFCLKKIKLWVDESLGSRNESKTTKTKSDIVDDRLAWCCRKKKKEEIGSMNWKVFF